MYNRKGYEQNITEDVVRSMIEESVSTYKNEIDILNSKVSELEKELDEVRQLPSSSVDIKDRETMNIGNGYIFSLTGRPNAGRDILSIVAGKSKDEQLDSKFQITKNSAISLVHNEPNTGLSYLAGEASNSIVNFTGSASISGNTITDNTLNLTPGELVGGTRKYTCQVLKADGSFLNVYKITGNTKNTITLSESPGISGGILYGALSHLYLGINTQPFQRAYVREDVDGGIRFGIGGTGSGDNGLLHMTGGRLYFRRPGLSGNGTLIA